MTKQEAMDRVKIHLKRIDECRAAGIMVESDVLKTLVIMAQKQMPKKLKTVGAEWGICSLCNGTVKRTDLYCSCCGQKVDWSDEDD